MKSAQKTFNPMMPAAATVRKVSRPGTRPRPKAITDPPAKGKAAQSAVPEMTGAVARPSTDVRQVMPVRRPAGSSLGSYSSLMGYTKKKGK